MIKDFFICVALLVTTTFSMYAPGDDVVQLDPSNFHTKVVSSSELWIVEFYAPWCGHCQSLAPEWKKAATALKGIVNVAAVDADAHNALGGQFGVRGFPTIKIFGDDKYKPSDYQGQRTASGIVEEALRQAGNMARQRLGGKSSGGGGQQRQGGGGSSGGDSGADAVVELTDANFDEKVLNSDDLWLVEFFAPWCGHCKNLEPHWKRAAGELKGKMKLGAVDATVHQGLAQKYGVQGFPTIKYFAGDQSEKMRPVDYDGGRTSEDIVRWAMDKVEENLPPPEVFELTAEDSLTKACEGHQLCIISVLPHILDCQSKCRNDYLTLLARMADKFKKRQWGYVWTEAGAQSAMEDALGIGGFGYPAMAALNARKKKFTLMRGSFAEVGINDFLREVSMGRGSSIPLKDDKLPTVVTTDPWDGKDGVLPEEPDELDLDEDEDETTKDEL